MNKIHIVAITGNNVSDNLDWLPSFIEVPDNTYIIIDNPALINGVVNFDLWIHFGYVDHNNRLFNEVSQLYPNKVLSINRLQKSTQAYMVNAAINTLGLKLFRPVRTFSTSKAHGKILVHGFFEHETIVVKRENGAKGAGHAVVPVWAYTAFQNVQDLPLNKLLEHFPDLVYSKPYSMISSKPEVNASGPVDSPKIASPEEPSLFEGDSVYVQEYLNIKSEYRVIISDNSAVHVYERKIAKNETGYAQANIQDKVVKQQVSFTMSEAMRSEINQISAHVGLGFGSMDIAELDDGSLVVLEYCNQFGVVGYRAEDLTTFFLPLIINSVSMSKLK